MEALLNALLYGLVVGLSGPATHPPPPVPVESSAFRPYNPAPIVIVESPCAEQPADCHVDAEPASEQK